MSGPLPVRRAIEYAVQIAHGLASAHDKGIVHRDGKFLVMPLDDSMGTNVWVASTADGKLRRVTDFGQKRTFIARRISWSSDGKSVFAVVGEGDADIVQMDGLVQ